MIIVGVSLQKRKVLFILRFFCFFEGRLSNLGKIKVKRRFSLIIISVYKVETRYE